jgi:hypothetical protein
MPNPTENQLAIVPFHPTPQFPEENPSNATEDEAESSAAAATRKRRRQVQVSVENLRRSPRSNKYQGFKQQIVSDRVERKSHVKPSCTLTITPPPRPVSDSLPVNVTPETEEEQGREAEVPPPTPMMLLQHIAVNLCGVPEEEISQEALLATREDEEEGGQDETEDDAEP